MHGAGIGQLAMAPTIHTDRALRSATTAALTSKATEHGAGERAPVNVGLAAITSRWPLGSAHVPALGWILDENGVVWTGWIAFMDRSWIGAL